MKSVNLKNDWRTRNEFANSKAIRKRISINLEKLMGKATEMCIKEDSNYMAVIPQESSDIMTKKDDSAYSTSFRKIEQLSCAEEYAKDLGLNVTPSGANKEQLKIGKYFTQFKFLGPIDRPCYPDAIGDVGFRLSIKKPPIMQHDPLEELALRTVECADDIRKAVKKIGHKRRNTVPKKIIPVKIVSGGKRLSKGTMGSMGFSCFRAIDKAYKDRANMEMLLKRTQQVKQMKELEDLSLEHVRAHKFGNRSMASLQKKEDKLIYLNALARRKQKDFSVLDNIHAKQNAHRDKQRKSAENYNFAVEFSCQNASVGKALANHDRNNRRDEESIRKSEHIDALRSLTEKKRALINGHMENAKLAKQMENMCLKRNLHTIINEKLMERFDKQVNMIKFQKAQKGTHMVGATLLPVKQFKSPVEHMDYL